MCSNVCLQVLHYPIIFRGLRLVVVFVCVCVCLYCFVVCVGLMFATCVQYGVLCACLLCVDLLSLTIDLLCF